MLFTFLRFFVRKWLRAVKIYLYAKFRASSSKIERVMLNFVFCALCFFTFFTFFVRKWLRAVKIYLHAKFRASSSKIEQVIRVGTRFGHLVLVVVVVPLQGIIQSKLELKLKVLSLDNICSAFKAIFQVRLKLETPCLEITL